MRFPRPAISAAWIWVPLSALIWASPCVGQPDPLTVRHWAYPDYTRVVIDVDASDAEAAPTIRYLDADVEAQRPQRLYFDFSSDTRHALSLDVGDGVVRGIRASRNRPDRTRVVLDLDRYVSHRVLTLPDPPRVVIDVFGVSRDAIPAGEAPAERVVVIDPGHGGRDPGALGIDRMQEKRVTLKVSRILAKELSRRGFKVVMTRDDDRWVSLEERTAIAEAHRADLFLSIHANAAPNRKARGIETYYLDRASRKQTLRVAARENGTTPDRLNALQRTLTSLRISENAEVSSELAKHLHQTLVHGVRVEHGRVHDLGVKRGPFQVLFLTEIPAVLVEVGFLTHPQEAKKLANGDYLSGLGTHIARGVERYWARRAVRVAELPDLP